MSAHEAVMLDWRQPMPDNDPVPPTPTTPPASPVPTQTYEFPLDEVQGNVTPGFKRDFQDFLFLRFPDDLQQVREWLKALQPDITCAKAVAKARKAYRAAQGKDGKQK